MEYVLESLYQVFKHYSTANQRMPLVYVKLYMYQIFRGLAYIHYVAGVCHRDLKPQNLLVDPLTHQVKICDFGSAKQLALQIFFVVVLVLGGTLKRKNSQQMMKYGRFICRLIQIIHICVMIRLKILKS